MAPRSIGVRSATIKSPPDSTEARADGLALGARVTHSSFGVGYITKLDGERVTILFEAGGTKKIAASFLQIA